MAMEKGAEKTQQKSSPPAPVPVSVITHPNYRTISPKRLYGAVRAGFFEFDIATEEQDFINAIATQPEDFTKAATRRTLEFKLMIDPFTFKGWVQFLQTKLAEYESVVGEISVKQQSKPVDKSTAASGTSSITSLYG